jgi:hypothetical protein
MHYRGHLSLTLMRMGKARKKLAKFSGLMLKKVINVRRLIFKDIVIDLNPHYPPTKKSVYCAYKILFKNRGQTGVTYLTKI